MSWTLIFSHNIWFARGHYHSPYYKINNAAKDSTSCWSRHSTSYSVKISVNVMSWKEKEVKNIDYIHSTRLHFNIQLKMLKNIWCVYRSWRWWCTCGRANHWGHHGRHATTWGRWWGCFTNGRGGLNTTVRGVTWWMDEWRVQTFH